MSLPTKIKAVLVPKHGDIDVIELGEVSFPEQKPNEVLIKVSSSFKLFIPEETPISKLIC